MTNNINQDNCHAIEFYGKTKILAQIPYLAEINKQSLSAVPLTPVLKEILGV